jgi:Cu/Zn superoxide dismutase
MTLPRLTAVAALARSVARKQTLVAAGLAAVALTGAACSAGQQAPATPTWAPLSAGQPISVPLTAVPAGTVTLNWDQSTERITATLAMYGFTPDSKHAMHIHPGTCADQSQPPSVPFSDISADASGDVNQRVASVAAAPQGIPANSYVNIHLAPMASLGNPGDVSFTPIACADIPAGTPAAGPVILKVRTPGPQGVPAGSASVRYDGTAHSLNVQVNVTGLPPNTAHAAHIHTGSCVKQGDVAYPLPDLQADASGHATLTSTVNNVKSAPPASGWYLNLHFGPMSQILDAAGQPTMLFAPILCGDIKG